ncbi:MAG TPA: phosphomannomutase/phosphoglucomutase [Acidimicrobiia bacterium]|nr:phosphomannomutase/phosphoglucomutase [Acidimicrobiia bacterium]
MGNGLDTIFKAYDVRGLYPDEIDEDVARRVGNAFAVFTGAERIVVARDMRPSSVPLSAAFIEGATLAGASVVDAGLASTDLIYFAAGRLDAPGAMFTASHNPAQYNGIKLCLAGAAPVGQDTGLGQIKAAVAEGRLERAESPGTVTAQDLVGEFADHVRSFVDVGALAPMTVVADTANGMGGLVVPRVFDGLPFDLTILFPELDGTFPNHPADPIQVENLRDLQAAIREKRADVGLAFDGDADRVFLVDDQAQPLSGSLTTSIVAKGILDKHPGETVVHNLICSRSVPDIIRETGGTPVRTRVGHSFIKAVMAETGAIFGGEHSGHYYFRDNWRADSGIIAALVVLEQLSQAGVPLSELRKPFERYAASGEINTKVADQKAAMEKVTAAYPDAPKDTLDGLSVDAGDFWFNVRPSNTEPLLRLNLEANDAETCARGTDEVLALIRGE